MVPGISKRQQLRNERALEDLIRTVPGNDRCADCGAANPGWASWNLGVFLCMRCASLHRKLGTHISKVKSLTMDSWSADQVDNMRSHGNTIINQLYNPKNAKPPIPTDIDESDSCMEQFIRRKYQHRNLNDPRPRAPSRRDSDISRSPDSSPPPPLPPKANRFLGFGLRTSSSMSNLRRASPTHAPPTPPPPMPPRPESASPPPPPADPVFESKLKQLRELGFQNERRNATALRGLSGNFDKTVETLQRLGEGPGNLPGRSRTPTTAGGGPKPRNASNPFDALDHKPPAQPNGRSYNPFDVPINTQPASAQPLETSFQNLQVSQPLFPHSTGGYPNRQMSFPQAYMQQPLTPPVTGAYSQQRSMFGPSQPQLNNNTFNNPFFQTTPQPQTAVASGPPFAQTQSHTQSNPFFSQISPQHTSMSPQPPLQSQPTGQAFGIPASQQLRHANTMPAFPPSSPYDQASSFQQQQQQQQQQQPPPFQNANNPFQHMTTTPSGNYYQMQFQPSQPQYNPQLPAQPLIPQTTGRMDKSSILSLYNLPPPQTPMSQQQQQPQQQSFTDSGIPPVPPLPTNPYGTTTTTTTAQNQNHGGYSPGAGSRNPFMGGSAQPQSQQQSQMQMQTQPGYPGVGMGMTAPHMQLPNGNPKSHMSQPSVDLSGMQGGRHSPDAFASLSARYA